MNSKLCFFDIETTSKDIHNAEIITGYFQTCINNIDDSSFYFESKVDRWISESEKIHKITFEKMLSFKNKKESLSDLYKFLNKISNDYEFVCYANPNNMGTFAYFDKAIIENELSLAGYRLKISKLTSAYDLAKKAHMMNLFDPIKNKETNRLSFSQSNVYKALFGESYENAHDAKSDVDALKRIYLELTNMIENNKYNINKRQIEMF